MQSEALDNKKTRAQNVHVSLVLMGLLGSFVLKLASFIFSSISAGFHVG